MSNNVEVKIKKLAEGVAIPKIQTSGASGVDVCYHGELSIDIRPFTTVKIPTGIAVAIPDGYELQVRPRSGMSTKRGLLPINSPGTIDSDYRGEIMIALYNAYNEPQTVMPGERIAQLVLQQVFKIQWDETDELDKTERGTGGFGHTGM